MPADASSIDITIVRGCRALRGRRLFQFEDRTDHLVRATINEVVRQVAQELHNTPAVCRRSYICPTVFDDWLAGELPTKWSGRRR